MTNTRFDFDHTKMVGPDADLETSLKEYGIAWIESEADILFYYGILYGVDDEGCDGFLRFDFCSFSKTTDPFKEFDWVDWKDIEEWFGGSIGEEVSMVEAVQILHNYYGPENVFGSSYWEGLTYEEIFKKGEGRENMYKIPPTSEVIFNILESHFRNDYWPDDVFYVLPEGTQLYLTWEYDADDNPIHKAQLLIHTSSMVKMSSVQYSIELVIPDFSKLKTRWFVNQYQIYREYGGPEEGGWWYDRYEPLSSEEVSTEGEAEELMWSTKAKLQQPKYNRYSVLGDGGDPAVYVEQHPPIEQYKPRPHYE